jgi:hypothetical protein
MFHSMRTTLNLDDDILATAKALAAQQRKPVGEVVSTLVRRALKPSGRQITERNGIPLFPVRKDAKAVTPEIIREILEEEA